QTVTATLRIRPARGFLNRDGADLGEYWQRQGIAWSAWSRGDSAHMETAGQGTAAARLRAAWRKKLHAALYREETAPAGTALIPALLFADQSGLQSDDLERVTRAGLRHSLALSGQHLAVAAVLALVPVAVLKILWPGIFLRLPRNVLLGLFSLPLAGLCLWLGDAPPSLIRAAVMLLVCVLAQWRARALTLPDGLCLALACLIAAQPACLFDLGVQLSFLAVAGMAAVGPWLRQATSGGLFRRKGFLPGLLRTPLKALFSVAVLSVAAQAAVLPLVLHVFGRAAPGLVTNMLWLPVMGLLVLPSAWMGMLLLAAGWDKAAHSVLDLAVWPCTRLLEGLRLLDAHGWLQVTWSLRPHWTAMLGAGALMASLALLFGRSGGGRAARRLAGIGVLLSLAAVGLRFGDLAQQETRIRLLDVGQGQAVLLEWPGGRGLIDGGGFASTRFDSGRDVLRPILTANRPPKLDFVAVSHMDRDHSGGIFFMLENFSVPLFVAGRNEDAGDAAHPGRARRSITQDHIRLARVLAARPIRARAMSLGERLDLAPGLCLEALWPPPGRVLRGNDSLVLRLVRHGLGLALFTGDLPVKEQQAMLRLHAAQDLRADVLILPHHGSRRNLEPALYDAVRPVLALVSAGSGNAWDFPSQEVRAALAERDIPLLFTAEGGELAVSFTDGVFVARPAAGYGLRNARK
ncbi:MAG: ComEC/Rec2 family competence protein, partial [Deltaproteobacteria bacterium]|nr:ComEC/Rec2 family competence protein [Deltaproteobacteria bacterium]